MQAKQVGPYTLRLCRPDEIQASYKVENTVWNPYNWEAYGSVTIPYTDELHIVAVNEDDEIIATIDGCPYAWDGNPLTLPAKGWTQVVIDAAEGYMLQPDYACALGASIMPHIQSSGLSKELLIALRDQALSLGYKGLLAPVRPSARARMPHLSIEEYVEVRLPDGRRFDPWVRTHEGVGGQVLGVCAHSAEFYGSRQDWEGWAGMKLPDNGKVLIPDATAYLYLENGHGYLAEESVWVLHV